MYTMMPIVIVAIAIAVNPSAVRGIDGS